MELAEVKKYFENAEFVETVSFNEKRKVDLDSIWADFEGDYFCTEKETGYIFCLGSKKKGFAKILTTKEPSFSITKDQLRQLTDPKVKEWFPDVFSLSKDFTGWVKTNSRGNKKYLVYFKGGILQHGFDGNGTWFDYGEYKAKVSEDLFKATKKEVFESLKIEAVRRGFVKGVFFRSAVSGNNYKFTNIYFTEATDMAWSKNGGVIFEKGNWATVISTITKLEAEKLLNKKIID